MLTPGMGAKPARRPGYPPERWWTSAVIVASVLGLAVGFGADAANDARHSSRMDAMLAVGDYDGRIQATAEHDRALRSRDFRDATAWICLSVGLTGLSVVRAVARIPARPE